MIRILLCCGGGFSSSAMTQKVKKEIIAKGMQDKVSIEFSPFSMAARELHDVDIMFVCPHQKYTIKEYNDRYVQNKIPIYLIPPKIYGRMDVEDVYQDAIDLIEIFKETAQNPVHFPGEDNVMLIRRDKAYAFTKK